jgi:hypothetical protein
VNPARVVERAVAIHVIIRTNTAALYAGIRPKAAAMGPHISREKPMAASSAALVMLMISIVVERSEAISGIAERIDVLANVDARVIQLTVKIIVYFRSGKRG